MTNVKNIPNGNIEGLHNPILDSVQLGNKVRDKRKKDGLTQQDLAAVAGVGVRFVSELENGKPSVQLNTVLAVLAALGLQLLIVDK
ncbi:helix-turn-helix transcriptional regulator [Thiomicrospira microaerophila]|uniref:helix-turn-helix transcriptional regulator n=1 Tax=Thiomicrospira microaerophila TaxID=406020 RepID=UPI00200E6FE1|nr:helix-turn-helix transcriptional regulator [Thiomicrospira microaerophila]UQB41891.1 helix-turn-helix transcriptional regulator [Thiomicrospira microaerophila]